MSAPSRSDGAPMLALACNSWPCRSTDRLMTYLGGLLVVGYIGTAAVVVIGPSTLRPWSAR